MYWLYLQDWPKRNSDFEIKSAIILGEDWKIS